MNDFSHFPTEKSKEKKKEKKRKKKRKEKEMTECKLWPPSFEFLLFHI